jgi:glycerol-3-phosphate dehydrogenase subunit B
MAATVYAANRGLTCVQVGSIGEINFATGLFDLISVHPANKKHIWKDPWAGIDALSQDIPNHPYTRLTKENIQTAFDELLSFLEGAGLTYYRRMNRNSVVLTSMGTAKMTYCVPHTMWPGVKALEKKTSCLLIDIRGLKGFSARQILSAMQGEWPTLRTVRISFPGMDHLNEVYTEHMASALILPQNRVKFAEVVKSNLNNAKVVGMPAILGMYRTQEVVSDLEEMIGAAVFEVPSIPPSVPGLRLKEAFERGLRAKGIQYFSQNRVLEVKPKADGDFELGIGRVETEHIVQSKAIILASGRFIGGGLHADRDRLKETIFDLPVKQPLTRAEWHSRDFLDTRGHLVNQAGLEIDDSFRPLNNSGQPAFPKLFAAGSILAYNDWKRIKCGAGVAIASAYGAVNSIVGS